FVAVGQWNSWFDTMLYNRMAENLTTLQYELMKLLSSVSQLSGDANVATQTSSVSSGQVTTASVRAAATILTCLPIVALYPFLQRYFVAGLTIGGVKE
ncbi:MAG TPA: carbohydrate ABC transporter permease, partial [Lachnospiraceae bacterium]|nr:carbohydrate ABC transporter permease [Lachnospiraceae bacterium]